MKNIFKCLIILSLPIFLSSCVKLSSLKMVGQPDVKVVGVGTSTIRVDVTGDMQNDGRKVTLKSYDLKVKSAEGEVILTIKGDDDIVIERGMNQDVVVPIKASLAGGGLAGLLSLPKLSKDGVYVEGEVEVKAFVKKSVKIKPMSLKRLANAVGMNKFNFEF